MAHAQLKRRIRLFDIPTKYIFTGHYDRKIFAHRETIFVALDNDSHVVSYSLLQLNQPNSNKIHFKVKPHDEVVFKLTEDCEKLLSENRNYIVEVNDVQDIDINKMEAAPNSALISEGRNYLYFKLSLIHI